MPVSLRRRLLTSYVTVAILGLGLTVVAFGWLLQRETLRQVRENLASQARIASTILSPAYQTDSPREFQERVRSLGTLIGARMSWIAPDGRVVADSYEPYEAIPSIENHRGRPEIAQSAKSGTGASIRYSETVHMRMLYVALAVRDKAGDMGFIRVAYPLAELDSRVLRLAGLVGGGAAIALAVTILMGLRFTGKIAGPVREMAAAAREVAQGDFGRQVAVPRDEEIGDLAKAINRMSLEVRDKIGQISRDKEQLQGILSGMIEGVLVLNRDGQIVLANESLERMFGLQRGSAVGSSCAEAIRHHELNEYLLSLFATGKTSPIEIMTHTPPVRIYTVQASRLGNHSGAVVVFHDITALKRLETIRKDFVANVSHELKTPLTAIKGFIEALIDGAGDDPQQAARFLDILRSQTDRLDAIVSDLLQLSSIESGKAVPAFTAVPLSVVIEKIVSMVSPAVEKRGHRLVVDMPEQFTVRADSHLLEQLVQNLVDNAVKYTPDGGIITIGARSIAGGISLSIRDNGIGIPHQDQTRIFERFYRVDRARSRELGGTGLGLSIVKHIADVHGWTVSLESTPGKGSAFTVHISA